jgi:flagellar hook protein FlgE
MIRSLYSGVSGMRSNQTKMDVIGNNIANVNTTGYKSGRVQFKDMLSQTISSAQTNKNPKQVGLGVSVSSIDTIFGNGALQPTGRQLDFAIEGEDFFQLSDGTFTRDGAFFMNSDKTALINSEGIEVKASSNPINSDGSIDVSKIYLYTFSNPGGLEKVGGNRYKETNASGTASTAGTSGSKGHGDIRQGVLEMSNVDLANEFTDMIVTSRAYQANSRTITTSDEMLQELINLKR